MQAGALVNVGQVSDDVTHGSSHTQVPLAFVHEPELRKLGDGAMLPDGFSELISARAAALGPFLTGGAGAVGVTAATCFGGTVVVATGVRRTTAGVLGSVGATVVGVTEVLWATTCAVTRAGDGAVVEVTTVATRVRRRMIAAR